jgi:RNase H-like domain found in reverse transcriptase/Integrase zinc binding domain
MQRSLWNPEGMILAETCTNDARWFQTLPNRVRPSKYASGVVLTQMDINGDRHPVAFLSKTFMDTEQQYKVYDRELLGIVWALRKWRHYIQGSGHTTLIHMDYWNLTYFWKAQKLSDWQARWSLFLSEFDIKLQHLPGNKMILSDALSRRLDHFPEEDETKEEMLLSDNLFLNFLDVNLRDRIKKNKEYDFDVTRAIELLQEEGLTNIQNNLEDWKIEEVDDQKTIFYKGKQYVPKDQELRRDILKLFHNHKTAGHPGELETYNFVKQHYWWPGLRIFVKNYVKGCRICQQFKVDQNPSHPSFILVEGAISTRPFTHCSMDLIMDLPLAEGSDSILVVVDQGLSKRVILCPTTKTVTIIVLLRTFRTAPRSLRWAIVFLINNLIIALYLIPTSFYAAESSLHISGISAPFCIVKHAF